MKDIPEEQGSLDRDRLALENWEKWMKRRKEACERLSKALDADPASLLMNRGDKKWDLDREKDAMFDAELIKNYKCRCGETGCPLFWKTTEPSLPGAKNLLSEVFFSPVKLTHENKKLSHLIEDGYVGHPRVILEEKGILGQEFLKDPLKKWKDFPYYIKKKEELKEEIQEVKNFVPEVEDLVVLGKGIVEKEIISDRPDIPDIVIEDYSTYEPEVDKPILWIGDFLIEGRAKSKERHIKKIIFPVDFSACTEENYAKQVKFSNKGPIAINYNWRRGKGYTNPELPLRFTKDLWPRFFFNKSDGILLPGQTFDHVFWFRSRTPGFYQEIWYFETESRLPPIRFELGAVVSKRSSEEKHENNVIDKYLKRLVAETTARDMAAMALHRVPIVEKEREQYSKFSEQEIFMHNNRTLFYHYDIVEQVKKLHNKYFEGEWNYSMTDLCDKLCVRLENEEKDEQKKVMKYFGLMYRKLQKKPITIDFTDEDWDYYKYHLCYLILCSGIAEMEKSLNYPSWGLIPPNAPPGRKEDFEGSFTDSSIDSNKKERIRKEKRKKKERDDQEDSDNTIYDEYALGWVEKEIRQEMGETSLNKVKATDLNLGMGVKFTKEIHIEEEQEDEFIDKDFESTDEEGVTKLRKWYLSDVDKEKKGKIKEPKATLSELINEMREKHIITRDLEEDESSGETVEEKQGENEEAERKRIEKLKRKLKLVYKYRKYEASLKSKNIKITKELIRSKFFKGLKGVKMPKLSTAKKGGKKPESSKAKKANKLDGAKKTPTSDKNLKNKEQLKKKDDRKQTAFNDKKIRKKRKVHRRRDPFRHLKLKGPPAPHARQFFRHSAEIRWRKILDSTIDDIAAVIETMNTLRGPGPITDINETIRMKYTSQ